MSRTPFLELSLTALLTAGLIGLPSSGLAAPAPAAAAPAAAASAPAPSNDYPLGPGDSVEVTLLGSSDFTTRAKLGSDGVILLPFIGNVNAVGRTPAQLADQIAVALRSGGYFAQPVVRVEVVAAASQYATVLGYVGAPGLISLDRSYRLSEIIARVGGRSEGGATYAVLTRSDGKSERFEIAALATGANDPVVSAGDKIYIPAGENEVYYVTGQVRSPGSFPSAGAITLRMALAKGGGVTEMGSDKRVKVVRDGKPLKNVDLDTTMVQAGDVITVGQRLF